jgi:hypothetical protein
MAMTAALGLAEPPDTSVDDIVGLGVNRNHVAWPSPETLLAELSSEDDATRLKALQSLGLTSEQAQRPKVVTPDQIRLIYAALGTTDGQQAIIAIEHAESAAIYVAVGSHTSKGWQRIAMFSCWCKYTRTLEEFLQLQFADISNNTSMYDLVLHPSGGGTGLYVQTEERFRVRDGEVRPVLSFVSHSTYSNAGFSGACKQHNATASCVRIERRSLVGSILVEGRGEFEPSHKDLKYLGDVLTENCHLQRVTCRPYSWDDKSFRYAPSGPAKPCPMFGER